MWCSGKKKTEIVVSEMHIRDVKWQTFAGRDAATGGGRTSLFWEQPWGENIVTKNFKIKLEIDKLRSDDEAGKQAVLWEYFSDHKHYWKVTREQLKPVKSLHSNEKKGNFKISSERFLKVDNKSKHALQNRKSAVGYRHYLAVVYYQLLPVKIIVN